LFDPCPYTHATWKSRAKPAEDVVAA
jgi:hypothetical protein